MTIHVDDNLDLELLAFHHAEPLLRLVHQNRDHLRRFLTWVDQMEHIGDMHLHIRNTELLHGLERDFSFVIIFQEKVAGRIGLHHVVMQHKLAAIGYWLSAELEGNGIMTKCCSALMEYSFRQLKLNRIEIRAVTANKRSQAIPLRLGFTEEATLRQAELLNGRFEDLMLFSMLRQDWNYPDNLPSDPGS